MDRQTIWAVTRLDDTHPRIVTLGYATSANDLFRVRGIVQTGHEGCNSCYTDVRTTVGLARLIEGGIASIQDLEAAENGLQVLMWHDRVDVIVPGFKYRREDLVSYARCEEPRSELAFEVLKPCQPCDTIYAVEEVVIEDRQVVTSSLPDSGIVGREFPEAIRQYLELTPAQAAAISSIPLSMSVPAYFSDPRVEPFADLRGFFGQFYKSIRRPWDEATSVVPDVDFSVHLPPLVSIVLDRASNRDAIPAAIRELREELAPARAEMLRLSETLRYGASDQREIESRCRDVRTSFEAAMPASRKPHTRIPLTILQLWAKCRHPFDEIVKHLNPEYVPGNPRVLANRTVTGRTFSKLLATDAIRTLVSHFFTPGELKAIEISARSER
jgi:hypothetical protein